MVKNRRKLLILKDLDLLFPLKKIRSKNFSSGEKKFFPRKIAKGFNKLAGFTVFGHDSWAKPGVAAYLCAFWRGLWWECASCCGEHIPDLFQSTGTTRLATKSSLCSSGWVGISCNKKVLVSKKGERGGLWPAFGGPYLGVGWSKFDESTWFCKLSISSFCWKKSGQNFFPRLREILILCQTMIPDFTISRFTVFSPNFWGGKQG